MTDENLSINPELTKIFIVDLKSINSQLILGNTQAQEPVHVANVQVGRDHRQLLNELDPSFLLKAGFH